MSPNCCRLLVKNIHRWPGRCRLKKTTRCAEADSQVPLPRPAFVDVEGSNLDGIFVNENVSWWIFCICFFFLFPNFSDFSLNLVHPFLGSFC